ncbi:hypothetical protein HN51_070713 [Arachis hypogaea]
MLLFLSLHDGDSLLCLATLGYFQSLLILWLFVSRWLSHVSCGDILLFPFLLYLCFDVKLFLTKFVLISSFKENHLLSFSTLLLLSFILSFSHAAIYLLM